MKRALLLPTLALFALIGAGCAQSQELASVTLYVAGDIATCWSDADEATAALIERLAPKGATWYVLALGDLAYSAGTDAQFKDCYAPSWGRFKSRTLPVPGNHEYFSGGGGYFRYWGARAAPPEGWYATRLAGWRLYALNSNCDWVGGCGAGSPQYAWLEARLRQEPDGCALAFAHYPRYSSGRHGDLPGMDALWDLLQRHRAELYLAGHDHDYERFAPRDAAGAHDPEGGLVQFVVGTGGAGLRQIDAPGPLSRAFVDDAHGVLELTLEPGGYAWRFVTTDGEVRDAGRASCR
ncbi:metallophosphoesterase [Oceanithermus sp.]|uniref:metallophosphoesterase family protein n=1 Tax=Oceanithermus sp. TaxID=2268145 RepID=UPI00257A794E|nr:metallophosphoesterase [Oceanithermus sp.]